MASTATALLALAAQQIGIREGRDANGNWNNLQKFGAWYGMNGVAWCDIFVSWCASFSGNGDIIPKSAYVPGRLAWGRSKGLTGHYPPAPGDLGIVMETTYAGNGQTTTHAVHIFLVEKYLGDGRVQTIEGNTNNDGSPQGNGVYRLVRNDSPTSSRYIYIRPQYVATAPPQVGSGGASAPPPAPAPAPSPAPAKPQVKVANVRPGAVNEDVRRFNALMWAWVGPTFRARWNTRWQSEPANKFGPVSQQVLQAIYLALSKKEPANFQPVALPTWPGAKVVARIGGTPV